MEAVEARELRYFVTVARTLHFGRAAAELHIAQPALSKTVRRVEARLGVELFARTSRSVALTDAGRVLLQQGEHALHTLDAAVERTRQAGVRHLRLVMKPGGDAGLLSAILAAYDEGPDASQVDIIFSGGTDRTEYLQDGRADVALLYGPFDDLSGLATQTLLREDRVAVLPVDHPLARRSSLRAAELAQETRPRWKGLPDDGGSGPEIADVAELLPLVRIGRVVAILPRSLVSPAPAGIVCVPVADAEPSRILVARMEHDHRPAVMGFMAAAVRAGQEA